MTQIGNTPNSETQSANENHGKPRDIYTLGKWQILSHTYMNKQ